ncbi:MAG: hypothetical protein KatS3mg023_1928 [Armatimonadota bacterium]|nr:MAG: hypothetical protein KatS3mg023_1928 [Armatimonadota bacterium]
MYRREATIRYFLRRGFALREAEDLTQEVQIRLWQAQQQGTESSDALWRCTCRSVLCDHLRRLRRERQLLVPLETAIDHPAPAQDNDLVICIHESLSLLPDTQRTIVHLHVVEGMTFEQIAVELGKTPCAVQKQYQRAIQKLRKYFDLPDNGGG